jgi:hypothetical protein
MFAPPNHGCLNSTHIHGTFVPVEERAGEPEGSGCDSVLGVFVTMGDSTKLRAKELARLARISRADHAEFAREQKADLLAFANRNHEIVELPPGLENGLTLKRKT